MGGTTFTGYDPIAIIDLFQSFKISCDHNAFSDGTAMCLFQFLLKKQAESLLYSIMKGKNISVDKY